MPRFPAAQVAAVASGGSKSTEAQPERRGRPPGQEDARPGADHTETGHELSTAAARSQSNENLAARARRHDYAVRVVSQRVDGTVVTQFYTNLPAAERKVSRTRDRGLRADLHLVRVVPVGVTPLPLVATAEMLLELVGGEDR